MEKKFRAWDVAHGYWLTDLDEVYMHESGKAYILATTGGYESQDYLKWVDVIICLYTGLKDKNGKEIYEGDIVKYYSLERHVQQSHEDINPEIDTCIIRGNKDAVVFNDGAFRIKDLMFDYIGLHDIDNIKEACGCTEDETCDINGNEINENILGIEVIGNIYEPNPSQP